MAQQDDGFLRDVENEIRRERLERVWKQYGTFIIIGAAAIVLGVLGYQFWQAQRRAAFEESGARYETALELLREKKDGSALAEFRKLADDGSGGYRALADLQAAGLLVKEGKKAEALTAYEALANNSNADGLLRDFARLQAAGLRLGEADFTEMENRLTPLMGDTAPWRFNARELLGIAAYRAGQSSEARTVLAPLLVDPATPEGVKERAQIVLAQIAAGELAAKATAGASTTDAATAPATKAPAADAAAPAASEPPANKE